MGILKRGMRNVIRNPIRLALVVILLGTSLLFVTAMGALNASAQARIDEMHRQIGTEVTIDQNLSDQQAASIEHIPGVVSYVEEIAGVGCNSPQLRAPQPPTTNPLYPSGNSSKTGKDPNAGGKSDSPDKLGGNPGATNGSMPGFIANSFPCYGFTPGAGAALLVKGSVEGGLRIVAGRIFEASENNANVALMGTTLAQLNHLHPGATFTINGTQLNLIGIEDTGSPWNSNVILPVQTARRVLHTGLNGLVVYASSYEQVQALAHTIRQSLGDQAHISTAEGQFDQPVAALTALQQSSLLALAAALLAAILIITFTVFLIVRERSKEIGILKAIGASNWQVVGQFAAEVLNMSLLAALVAALLLILVGPAIASAATPLLPSNHGQLVSKGGTATAPNLTLSITLTPQSILILLIVGIVLAVLASSIPAWYVARIKPAQVLRTR